MSESALNVAPAELEIGVIDGESYKLRDWLTSYPFLLVAIDPYTVQSSWILDTASEIFDHFTPADVRVGWICSADSDGCSEFLGPLADRYLTIADPDHKTTKALGVEALPSLIHIRSDGYLQRADGWDPTAWKKICDWVAKIAAWNEMSLRKPNMPGSYAGTPIAG